MQLVKAPSRLHTIADLCVGAGDLQKLAAPNAELLHRRQESERRVAELSEVHELFSCFSSTLPPDRPAWYAKNPKRRLGPDSDQKLVESSG